MGSGNLTASCLEISRATSASGRQAPVASDWRRLGGGIHLRRDGSCRSNQSLDHSTATSWTSSDDQGPAIHAKKLYVSD